jgi:hypothetical protein
VSYQKLNAACIVETLLRLEHRIGERFPGSSLAAVCRELIGMAETAQQRSVAIASPHYLLRTAVFLVIAAGLGGLLFVAFKMNVQVGTVEIFSVFQGVEAAMNIVVLSGAMLFFLVSLETRIKRRRSLICTGFARSRMSSTCISSPRTRAASWVAARPLPHPPNGR